MDNEMHVQNNVWFNEHITMINPPSPFIIFRLTRNVRKNILLTWLKVTNIEKTNTNSQFSSLMKIKHQWFEVENVDFRKIWAVKT